jgi:hypothetical protein
MNYINKAPVWFAYHIFLFNESERILLENKHRIQNKAEYSKTTNTRGQYKHKQNNKPPKQLADK